MPLNLKKNWENIFFWPQSERCSQVFVACWEDNFFIKFFNTFCCTFTDANNDLLFHCHIFFFFAFLEGKLIINPLMTCLQIHRPWWREPSRCCHRRRPGTGEPGVLRKRSYAVTFPPPTFPILRLPAACIFYSGYVDRFAEWEMIATQFMSSSIGQDLWGIIQTEG